MFAVSWAAWDPGSGLKLILSLLFLLGRERWVEVLQSLILYATTASVIFVAVIFADLFAA